MHKQACYSTCTVKNVNEGSPLPAGNTKTSRKGFFPERKTPGIPETPEVFPARKSLISDIIGFPDGDQDHSLTF